MQNYDLFACRSDNYPSHAGYKENTTSKDAAIKITKSGRAEALRVRVYEELKLPMTAKEVAGILQEEITSIRPRITELKAQKKVTPYGDRRNGEHVWVSV